MDYKKTVSKVDLERFMKKWYVIAGRVTFMEKGAHNAVEEYRWNPKENRIDISFYFNKDSFEGPLKKIPQKAWLENKSTNAHWKVSPFWPLKFDYYVIALAEDYSWTAIGVPNQKYLWIMADKWDVSDTQLAEIIAKIKDIGYDVQDVVRIPQKW
jgi:apolipoprotein D and lipocalin family protein